MHETHHGSTHYTAEKYSVQQKKNSRSIFGWDTKMRGDEKINKYLEHAKGIRCAL